MTTKKTETERMDLYFSMFNCHVNNAEEKATEEFIAIFGKDKHDEVIQPIKDEGIMSLFNDAPTPFTMAYAVLVCHFANTK